MELFYQNITTFPTVFFTFFLGVTLLYWLVAILGIVQIDVLDFDINPVESALDIGAEHGLDGPGDIAGLMLKLGLHGVPVTIMISLIALFGWFFCYYIVYFFFGFIPQGILYYLAGLPVLLLSFYIAVIITAQLIKPLRILFRKTEEKTIKHILGQVAVVRTSRVDSNFGEAVLDDRGAGLILRIRTRDDVQFKKGDKVVLLEYLANENAYRVISENEFLNN